MAERLNKRCSDQARDHIQTIQLIKRLKDHVDNDVLSQSQVRAAEILLRKTLPDMKVTEISGPDGSDIPTSIRIDYCTVPGETEDTEPTE